MARSRRTSRVLILPMLPYFFDHEARGRFVVHSCSLRITAGCSGFLFSAPGKDRGRSPWLRASVVEKPRAAWGKTSTLEVLRLRALKPSVAPYISEALR